MVDKVKAVVRIAGREYTIRAFDTEEYIHRVAIYVNRKMEEITNAQPGLSTAMAAILTAINLGDEVLKLKDEVESLRSQVNELKEAYGKVTVIPGGDSSAPAIYDVSRKGKRQ
ncbi:MAG TPA: cell division protein ZapA [Clostridiales bacterium]|nr:cell division protein ZapA [Clostridiales bacterium]